MCSVIELSNIDQSRLFGCESLVGGPTQLAVNETEVSLIHLCDPIDLTLREREREKRDFVTIKCVCPCRVESGIPLSLSS